MSLSPNHEGRGGPIPDHPYRDSVLFHGALGLALVVLSAFSSQGLARGLLIGLGYFAAATAWSWWRFHSRIKAQALERARAEADAQTAVEQAHTADAESGAPR
jgi:hypothetical protein